jgi:hypothetical protein
MAIGRTTLAYRETLLRRPEPILRAMLPRTLLRLCLFEGNRATVASLAIALTFSQKSSAAGIWFCIAIACIVVFLLSHERVGGRYHGLRETAFYGTCFCLPVVAFGYWLAEPPLLSLVFKNNDELNAWRRYRIRRQVTYFSKVGICLTQVAPTGSMWG